MPLHYQTRRHLWSTPVTVSLLQRDLGPNSRNTCIAVKDLGSKTLDLFDGVLEGGEVPVPALFPLCCLAVEFRYSTALMLRSDLEAVAQSTTYTGNDPVRKPS